MTSEISELADRAWKLATAPTIAPSSVYANALRECAEMLRRTSERSDEAMIEAVREVCARQAERFYDNPNLEDHLKPALEVARICGKQISDSIRKLHFNDDFRASVSSPVTEKTDG